MSSEKQNKPTKKIKVGFMPYGVHVGVKDATDRYFIDEELMREAQDMLSRQGMTVIPSDEVVSYKPQAKAALDKFIAEDVDVLVMYATTWV